MNAWQTALSILKRPIEAPPLAELPKAAGRKFVASPSLGQLQQEVEAALAEMSRERAAATALIASAGQRREDLLMQPDTDDKILALGGEIDRAQLLLERLDRVEPDLQQRLGEIKTLAREERWELLRDNIAARLEAFTESEARYHAERDEWLQLVQEAERRFTSEVYTEHVQGAPNLRQILPWLPELPSSPTDFAEQIATFRTCVLTLRAPPKPAFSTLGAMIEAGRHNGSVPDECPPDWRDTVERAMRPSMPVEMKVSGIASDGSTLPKGTIIEMTYEDAHRAVVAGRAAYAD